MSDVPLLRQKGFVRSATRWGAIFCLGTLTLFLYVISPEPPPESSDLIEAASRKPETPKVSGYLPYRDQLGPAPRNLFTFGTGFKAPGPSAYVVAQPKPVESVKVENPNPSAETPTPTPTAPEVDLNGLILLAAWSEPNGGGLAYLSDGSKTFSVGKGESVRNGTVARIEPGALILTNGSKETRLNLISSIKPLTMDPFKTGGNQATIRIKAQPIEKPRPEAPKRKKLGIGIKDLSFTEAAQAKAPNNCKLAISAVYRSDVDVKEGDLVLAVSGQPVTNSGEALKFLQEAQKDPDLVLKLMRDGHEFDVRIPWKE